MREIPCRSQEEIAAGFLSALESRSSLEVPQDELLRASGARATGLWRLEEGHLTLLGFRAVQDMAEEVRAGFAEATARVPLDRVDLGIVMAAVAGKPAAAYAEETSLGGSAGWLRRFGALQSLAVPIARGNRVLGVIAISSPERFDRESPAWILLEEIAAALGPAMSFAPPP